MEAIRAVSGSCQPCPLLKKELEEMGIPCDVHYLEAHPEWIARFGLRGSPDIIVGGEPVFRKMPEFAAFRRYFEERQGM